MQTRIIFILACALVLAGCGGDSPPATPQAGTPAVEEERLAVVAAFYPLAWAAEEIGGERVEVTNLTPPGADPHDIELSARDVQRVHDADLVLYIGEGFQPTLERILEAAPARRVDLLEGLELRHGHTHEHGHEDEHEDEHAHEDEHGHEDEHEDEHGHDTEEAVDPHVWLDPIRFAAIAKRIGLELGGEEEANALVGQLEALHAEYEEGLRDCSRRELVTTHAAFGYLAERYGLTQISIAGLSHEAEPSARELEGLVAEVREHDATTVFVEPLASPRLAQTVARETGATTAMLNPLEGLSREEADREDGYLTVMRTNLETLRRALGCR